MHLRPAFVASALCLAGLVLAAPTSSAGDEKRSTVSVRFLAFDALDHPCVLQTADGRWESPNISNVYFGRPVRLSTKTPLALFAGTPEKQITAPPSPGESPPAAPAKSTGASAPAKDAKPVATVALIDAPRQFVFLFKAKDTLRALVMPDTGDNFPFGSVLTFNLTKQPVQASLGKSRVTVVPGGKALAAGIVADNQFGDVTVQFRGVVNGTKALLYSTTWVVNPETRTFVFLYEDAAGRVLVKPISDANVPGLLEAPEEKPAKSPAARKN